MRARAFRSWAAHPDAGELGIAAGQLQVLESTHPLYRAGVGIYNAIQRRWPRLHHAYFNFLELASLHRNPRRMAGKQHFVRKLREFAPDAVVSTHAHLNHGYFALVKQTSGAAVPCITYCGELHGSYGFSRHWVNPEADLFIGAVEPTTQAAIRLGMPRERAWTGGFLLAPGFFDAGEARVHADRAAVHRELNLDPAAFTLLLATGANAANNHLAFLAALESAGVRPQVIALCGRSEPARKAVEAWAAARAAWPVRALGYTGEVPRLMRASSAIVARPGTGTTSEAMLSGCPLIFNGLGGIMPQEAITVRFAREHGFARLIRRPHELPEQVVALRDDPGQLARSRAMLRGACPAGHPLDILKRITHLAAPA